MLKKGWVTGSDGRAIRLAFNLFNGRVPYADIEDIKMSDDNLNLFNEYGNFIIDWSELLHNTPCYIFSDGCIFEYLMEGLRLRFSR